MFTGDHQGLGTKSFCLDYSVGRERVTRESNYLSLP